MSVVTLKNFGEGVLGFGGWGFFFVCLFWGFFGLWWCCCLLWFWVLGVLEEGTCALGA